MALRLLSVVVALQLVSVFVEPCDAQRIDWRGGFEGVQLVEAEIELTEQFSNSDGREFPPTTTTINVVRDGLIWGVKNTQIESDGVWHEYVATRGSECLRLSYLEGKTRVTGLDMVLTSERVGGKDSKQLFQQMFPNNHLQLIALGALHGRLIDEDFFSRASVKEVADGQLRIKAELDVGVFEATCDPDQGFLPVQMTLSQRGDHLHNGRPLNSIVMNGGGVSPVGKIESNLITVDSIECARFSNGWYIKSWNLTKVLTAVSGSKVTIKQNGQVTSISSGSSLDTDPLFFDAPIPDRQAIGVDGADLDYVWDGMWAVPSTTALHKFPPLSRSRYSKWWFPCLAILVVTVGVFINRKGWVRHDG